MQEFMWDLFLAHPGPQKPAAEMLYDLLSPHARVFLDSRCLELGDDWDRELPRAQEHSLISVILISSRTDGAYYEREEIAAAIDLARTKGRKHRVVPVYLDAAAKPQDGVPYGLRLKQGLIASEVGGIPGVAQQLLQALQRLRQPQTRSDEDASASDDHGPLPVPPQPAQPQFLYRCAFQGDPVSYFVTVNDEIVAIAPQIAPTIVGRKLPATWPGLAWMYQTATITYGVDQQGRIWNRWPNGMQFQVGQVFSL